MFGFKLYKIFSKARQANVAKYLQPQYGPFVEHYVIHEFLPSDSKNSHTTQALCQYAVMGLMAQNSFQNHI